MKQNKKDSGILFAINNIDKAIDAASMSPRFNYLLRALATEKRRISSLSKTGDLVRYYDTFKDGNHRKSDEFRELKESTGAQFWTNEELSVVLQNAFPDEIKNKTTPEDFCVGESYSNDFLSLCLGGSYALSFRLSREGDYGYLVVSSADGGFNKWEDDNTFLFSPPSRFFPTTERYLDFIQSYKNRKFLIFDRSPSGGFTYKGIFKVMEELKEGKVAFKRSKPLSDQEKDALKKSKKAFSSKRTSRKAESEEDLLNGLLQELIAHHVYFKAKKISDDKSVRFALHVVDYLNKMGLELSECILVIWNSDKAPKTDDTQSIRSAMGLNDQQMVVFVDAGAFCGKDDLEKGVRHLNLEKVMPQINYQEHFKTQIQSLKKGKSLETSHFLIDDKADQLTKQSLYCFLKKAILADAKFLGAMPVMNGHSLVEIQEPYERIGCNARSIVIDFSLPSGCGARDSVAYIDLSVDAAVTKKGTYFVLGKQFVSVLAFDYPHYYYQFVQNASLTVSGVDRPRPDSMEPEEAPWAKEVIDENKRDFIQRVKTEDEITLFIGNGVSMPYGSETWQELSKHILEQLAPKHIESVDRIDGLLGKNVISSVDFAKEVLSLHGEEELYWSELHHCIYRRYGPKSLDDETALKAIARAKRNYPSMTLLTYNYDQFLEDIYQHDNPKKWKLKPALPTDQNSMNSRTVIHLHGYLPKENYETNHKGIVLTRREYFESYDDIKNPVAEKQIHALKNGVSLFIGSSLTDIFQLRLIEEAAKTSANPGGNSVYALMRVGNLTSNEQESIYKYFLSKHVLLLSFKEFKDLPSVIDDLFKKE